MMLDFIKMQATGNNYIYIDCIKNNLEDYNLSLLSKEISNPNYGIGSDGLILIYKSQEADARMIMYNKDGSEGHMCGNGIRCVGKYIYENYFQKNKLLIETNSGIKEIQIITKNDYIIDIVVNMGIPIFSNKYIPVNLDDEITINKKIIFDNNEFYINCVSIGNPHTVIFVENVDSINVNYLGKIIQESDIFPNKCNVNFVQLLGNNKIKMRVFERGSGETLSCGTGACASVVIGVINKFLDFGKEVEVELEGGKLYIIYKDNIYMRGPAETICYGKYLVKNKKINKNITDI